MDMAGYDETLSEFEFDVVDYKTLTQDFAAELSQTTNYDAMLSTKPPDHNGYSFNSGRACFGQRRSAGKSANVDFGWIMDSAADEQDNWRCYVVEFGIDCPKVFSPSKNVPSSDMPRLDEYEELEGAFPDILFGEDCVAGCTSDQSLGEAESNAEMNDPPWEDRYHMADGIPSWIEWEGELRNLFKEVSRLELDMSRY
jgi:hypothetical protein